MNEDIRSVSARLDEAPGRLSAALDAVTQGISRTELIDVVRALEELKNIATAMQAVAAVDFARAQRGEQLRRGVPADRVGRGVAEQIALARRESPHRGAIFLGVASVLVSEMPQALAAMATGVLTEHRAQILVHETSCVSREVRAEVDEAVAGDLGRLSELGTRRLTGLVRAETYRRDPASAVARVARAEADRFVSSRPAPDCMVKVTALLPVAQGVAAFAALVRAADSAQAAGDGRTRGQVMADEFVVRLTGQARADAVPVAVHLVMPAGTLLASADQPGRVLGNGPVPADVARRLVAASPRLASWARRLYESPAGGLVAMESHDRLFPKGLAQFITIRDDLCRTPYCDAQIRHIDHVIPYAEEGPTSEANGQGLCERCNHAKQAPGWTTRSLFRDLSPEGTSGPHEVVLTTPTGHQHISRSLDGS